MQLGPGYSAGVSQQVKAQMQEQGLLRQGGALRHPVLDTTGAWDVAQEQGGSCSFLPKGEEGRTAGGAASAAPLILGHAGQGRKSSWDLGQVRPQGLPRFAVKPQWVLVVAQGKG